MKIDMVSKTSRHHKRGGKSKNKVKDKSQSITIDFLNIRDITSKMGDLNCHLKSEKVCISIFGCAETFSTSDEKPYNLDNDYQWVGKCRKGNKSKGGIGSCVSRELTILDDNLTDSNLKDFGRSL